MCDSNFLIHAKGFKGTVKSGTSNIFLNIYILVQEKSETYKYKEMSSVSLSKNTSWPVYLKNSN